MNSPLATDIHTDDAVARKLGALAHPVRLKILRHLGERDACCVKDIVCRVGLAQSTISQHLKVLVDAGLVSYRAERQKSRYSLEPEALAGMISAISDIVEICCKGACRDSTGATKKQACAEVAAACDDDKDD